VGGDPQAILVFRVPAVAAMPLGIGLRVCGVQGVDLVWESVGGEMFETCVHALANGGRLIVIGQPPFPSNKGIKTNLRQYLRDCRHVFL